MNAVWKKASARGLLVVRSVGTVASYLNVVLNRLGVNLGRLLVYHFLNYANLSR